MRIVPWAHRMLSKSALNKINSLNTSTLLLIKTFHGYRAQLLKNWWKATNLVRHCRFGFENGYSYFQYSIPVLLQDSVILQSNLKCLSNTLKVLSKTHWICIMKVSKEVKHVAYVLDLKLAWFSETTLF